LIFAGFTVNDSVKLQFLNYHETSGEPREPARTEDTTAELDAARVCLFVVVAFVVVDWWWWW
jgi:hypothetical protein